MKMCYVKKFKKKQEKITEVGSFVEQVEYGFGLKT